MKFGFLEIFLIIVVVLCLILGLFFSKQIFQNKESGMASAEKISCSEVSECDDGNSCTIDTCRKDGCYNTKVVLCYQNDGCCPKSCTPENDNDC